MKKYFALPLVAFLFSGCIIGIRSNMSYNVKKNTATTEGRVFDSGHYDLGAPVVNAESTKTVSDNLNGSGNGNGQNVSTEQQKKQAEEKQDQPAAQ